MDIKYTITFFSDWHCGSGLASGANLDSLVIKDNEGFPYIPGRTIKGLLREAAEEIKALQNEEKTDSDALFGTVFTDGFSTGSAFFSNAVLPREIRDLITSRQQTEYLYRSFASTAIDGKSGTAKKNSLRKMETVIPTTLEGQITNVPESCLELLSQSLKYIKRLGQGRNRGLGRCKFDVKEG